MEDHFVGTVTGQVKNHSTACYSHSGGDLKKTQSDRVDAQARLLAPRQPQSPKAIHQDIRKR